MNIFREIADSFIDAELEVINSLVLQDPQPCVKEVCGIIKIYLENEKSNIFDDTDLISIKKQLSLISEIIDLFIMALPNESSWWVMPLVKECYELCNLDFTQRKILIIHSQDSSYYKVIPDITSNISNIVYDNNTKIDIFIIPIVACYDVSSISILGHEVGHIALNSIDIFDKFVTDEFVNQYPDNLDLLDYEKRKELKELRQKIALYIAEYVCDHIGYKLFGPAFAYALLKEFCPYISQPKSNSDSHPSQVSRFLNSYKKLKDYFSESEQANKGLNICIKNMIDNISPLLGNTLKPLDDEHQDKIEQFSSEVAGKISDMLTITPSKPLEEIWKLVEPEINAFRPPFEKVSENQPEIISPIEAVTATSIYYHGKHYTEHNDFYKVSLNHNNNKISTLHNKLIDHLKYAISLYDFAKASNKKCCQSLSAEDLTTTLWSMRTRDTGGSPNPLVITPSIDPKSQYSPNSVDLRLGTSFLLNKLTNYTHVTPTKGDGSNEIPLEKFYIKKHIQVGDDFILHPHHFILATTLEYICLPYDYYALVLGRSSWGRLGLTIATATTVHAGFRGCLTLELRNLGETPLLLKVGLRIAQLCLISVQADKTSAGYYASSGKYIGPVSAEIPKIRTDCDWDILDNYQKNIAG
ncbi:dCTP deaminase [Candidatus Magnetominusculus dajiuhuensis]|uniref:dCTP deaminase n=1 Tax=Candidatus Magnetominusculus dajiuhuensis TaxID=3137712 RepID=UPI003B431104